MFKKKSKVNIPRIETELAMQTSPAEKTAMNDSPVKQTAGFKGKEHSITINGKLVEIGQDIATNLETFRQLLDSCHELSITIAKNTKDSTYESLTAQVKESFGIHYEDIKAIINDPHLAFPKSPLSPQTTSTINELRLSFYVGLQSLSELESRFKELAIATSGITILSKEGKKRRLYSLLNEFIRHWAQIELSLTSVLARASNDIANTNEINMRKIAILAGAQDFELVSENDAKSFFLQAEAYRTGHGVSRDYEQALKRYMRSSDLGNADASLAIGMMHEKGQGRPANIDEAIKWYRLAVEQGSAAAKYLLGKFYMEGVVVGQDLKFAAQCFYEAAGDDHVDAMVDFGHLAETLQGNAEETAENVKKAIFWYKKAVSYNSPRAQVLLGSCYFRGLGVEQDYLEAVGLFRKAADQNYAHAYNNLGICYEEGRGVPKDLGLAKQFYHAAAKLFHPSALSNYAYICMIEKDYREALKKFNMAAALGNADAMYYLGNIFESGCQVAEDYAIQPDVNAALRYYNEASEKGHTKAQIRAGKIHLLGPEHLKDIPLAIKLVYEASSVGGDSDAMCLLGQMYQMGIKGTGAAYSQLKFDGKPRHVEAAAWYQRAAIQGHAHSLFNLGVIHEYGLATEKEMGKAIKLFRQAARMGYLPAKEKIKELEELHIIA